MQKEVATVYLGHIVSADGVKPDPRKVSAVLDSQAPSSVKELRHFLGLTNCYRKFISSCASIAYPLYKLLKGTRSLSNGQLPADRHLMHLKLSLLLPLFFVTQTLHVHLFCTLMHLTVLLALCLANIRMVRK